MLDTLFLEQLLSGQQQPDDIFPASSKAEDSVFKDVFQSLFDVEAPELTETLSGPAGELAALEANLLAGIGGSAGVVGSISFGEIPDEDEEDAADSQRESQPAGPTAEQVDAWINRVVTDGRFRVWKEHGGQRFQSRCFAVEWKGSVVVDEQGFMRELFRVLGGELSFVLGVEVRKTRADYMMVARMQGRVRWRDWREKLMFGHGGDMTEPGLFIRVRVPRRGTDDGVNTFVSSMKRRCEGYPQVFKYKADEMEFRQGRGYGQGRRQRSGGLEIET